jgi:predicted amidophosphoribosyltransferase
MWKRFDFGPIPPALEEYTSCIYYMHEYRKDINTYNDNPVRSKIHNLKKDISCRSNPHIWHYKLCAIEEMAEDISMLIGESSVYCAPMPTSMMRSDERYDNRLELVVERVARSCQNVTQLLPFDLVKSVEPFHRSRRYRNAEVIASNIIVNPNSIPQDRPLVLIDDIITSGALFRACCMVVHRHHPSTKVYGVFWARTLDKSLTNPKQ